MDPHLNCVGYLRVSSQGQVSTDGFPRQSESISRCCELKGFTILREYHEEGVPGKLDEESRPAFQEMISDLLGNGCRTVVVEGMHRLAREYRTQEHLIIYLASKGITLISADTGEDITAAMMGDPMRRALVQIQGIFAELEKNMLVSKLAKARQRKKDKTGKGQGRHAFGEKPEEKEALMRIMAMAQAGYFSTRIAEVLNSEVGMKTRSGKPWNRSTVAKIIARNRAQSSPPLQSQQNP